MVDEPRQARGHPTLTLAVLTVAGLSYALQQTMVVPALPELQRDLGTTTTWATWILSVFLLTASVATPLFGKLGDQYGKERLLLVSLSIFLVGSIGSALAWNIGALIAFRAVQGAAGAIFPLSFAIIRDEFPHEKIPVAFGLVSAVFGVGGGLGIVLSGVLTDNLSWRWIFIVGAAAVAVAIVLVWRFVPESPVKAPSRLDVPGALLLSAGLVSLLLGLTEGDAWGFGSARILGLFLASGAFLLAWALVEMRVDDPMVDMRMLARRTVLFTNLTALIAGFAMFGAFVLVPNFVEMPRGLPPDLARLVDYGFGASTTKAGLYMLPASVAMLVVAPVAGILGRRIGPKWPLFLGATFIAAGAALLASLRGGPSSIVTAMLVLGVGVAFSFAAMPTLIASSVGAHEMGVATGMNTVMRTIGGVIGGQVGAALLASDTIGGTKIPAESAFVNAFWASAAAALLAAAVSLFVVKRPRRPGERIALAQAGR